MANVDRGVDGAGLEVDAHDAIFAREHHPGLGVVAFAVDDDVVRLVAQANGVDQNPGVAVDKPERIAAGRRHQQPFRAWP